MPGPALRFPYTSGVGGTATLKVTRVSNDTVTDAALAVTEATNAEMVYTSAAMASAPPANDLYAVNVEFSGTPGEVLFAYLLTSDTSGTVDLHDSILSAQIARGQLTVPASGNWSTHTAEDVRTEMDANSTQLTAIVADTNELQTNQGAWATATGFATPTNVTDARDAILTQGNTAWATATGFSTHSAAAAATAVRSELATELARIDVAVSTRLATGGYTVPLDAAGVRSAVGLAAANLDTQLADVPTVAEFNARTIPAADYFDPATDAVANVTLVGTCTTNTDMRGTNSAATAAALASLVTTVGAAGSGLTEAGGTGDQLTAIPWNAAWDTEVQSEAQDALDAISIDGKTLVQALQIIGATTAGKVSGAGTATEVFKGLDGTTTRATVTADEDGNRTAVTYG